MNNVRFFNQNGLNSFFLRNKSYDLIVANILLITHRKLVKQYYNKLKNNGEIVIYGILIDQEMEIISIFNKFNLIKLKKKFYSFKWVGLIFKKKEKMNMINNLEKLIKEISLKKIDFYVISTNDENLLEYTPDQNKRLQWLTKLYWLEWNCINIQEKNFFLLMEDIFYKQKKK